MSTKELNPGERFYELVVAKYKGTKNVVVDRMIINQRHRDRKPELPLTTLLRKAKSADRATRWAEKFGTVLSCQKVDASYHLYSIEHLNLKQKPLVIEVAKEREFILGSNFEISGEDIGKEHGIIIEVERP